MNNNLFVGKQLKNKIFKFPEHIMPGIPRVQSSLRFPQDFRNFPIMLRNNWNMID